MRLEIAERLRCPRSHAPTPLVLVAERVVERELLEGVAGCPVCLAEAQIREGSVWFGGASSPATPRVGGVAAAPRVSVEALDRFRAQLVLGEPDGAVLLTGSYARFAEPLATELDQAVVVIAATATREGAGSAVHLVERVVPFSDHTFRAAALDATLDAALADDAVRCVAVGGRVLGAAALAVPALAHELARDQTEWLAEREAGPGGVVRIRRA